MSRFLVVPLALFAATLAVPSAALAQKPPVQVVPVSPQIEAIQDKLVLALQALEQGDYDGALRALDAVVVDPAFKEIPASMQTQVYRLIASVADETGRVDRAWRDWSRVTEADDAVWGDWWARALSAHLADEPVDAVTSLAEAVRLYPALVTEAPEGWIYEIMGTADAHPEAQARLIEALTDAGWEDTEGWVWMAHAAWLLDGGKTDQALAFVARIEEATPRLLMGTDRRFDGLRAQRPDLFQIEGAAAAELEEARLATEAPEAALSDWNLYAAMLHDEGRLDEALRILDREIAEAERPRKPGEAAVDPDDFIWALDTRSRIRIDMGDIDGGLADLRRAARRPEGGEVNVSHAINLGNLYVKLDRPADALEATLDVTAGRLAPYGRIQLAEVRACAHAALGDLDAARAEIAYIEANPTVAPDSTWGVYACVGDEDAAAAALIALLEDPRERLGALYGVQIFAPSPETTPGALRRQAFHEAVLARPDVSAAIEAVGRRQTWDRMAPGF
jgi:tetratricopeptide (TPR) repeat protein